MKLVITESELKELVIKKIEEKFKKQVKDGVLNISDSDIKFGLTTKYDTDGSAMEDETEAVVDTGDL
jgi:hypothetical protein